MGQINLKFDSTKHWNNCSPLFFFPCSGYFFNAYCPPGSNTNENNLLTIIGLGIIFVVLFIYLFIAYNFTGMCVHKHT